MGKGRSRRRRELRNYSQLRLTEQQSKELRAKLIDYSQQPIATAILGAVLVEHELDNALRHKFRKMDDDTWELLAGENGPLGTFYQKILLGYAFSLYDKKVRDDLGIVRTIRNSFAHSRKVLDFADEYISMELNEANNLTKKLKKFSPKTTKEVANRTLYICLCYILAVKLMRKRTQTAAAANRRFMKRNPFVRALLPFLEPPLSGQKFPLPPIAGVHSVDPSAQEPRGLLDVLSQESPSPGDKKGK